jgi:hypothetical protein
MISRILYYKKKIIYFFIFLFLASKIGLSLNFHYCGDKISLISFSSSPKGCNKKVNDFKNHKKYLDINNQDCCKDDLVFIQNDKPENFKIVNTKKENFKDVFILNFIISHHSFSFYNYSFNWKPPPKTNQNLYLFYNQFILYG